MASCCLVLRLVTLLHLVLATCCIPAVLAPIDAHAHVRDAHNASLLSSLQSISVRRVRVLTTRGFDSSMILKPKPPHSFERRLILTPKHDSEAEADTLASIAFFSIYLKQKPILNLIILILNLSHLIYRCPLAPAPTICCWPPSHSPAVTDCFITHASCAWPRHMLLASQSSLF